MSRVMVSNGSALKPSVLHSFSLATMPSIRKLQSSGSTIGVGPAVSTGQPDSAYWPGGSLSPYSSCRLRPPKPREMKSLICRAYAAPQARVRSRHGRTNAARTGHLLMGRREHHGPGGCEAVLLGPVRLGGRRPAGRRRRLLLDDEARRPGGGGDLAAATAAARGRRAADVEQLRDGRERRLGRRPRG